MAGESRVSGLTAQIVVSSSGTPRIGSLAAQIVTQGTSKGVRVSSASAQIVTTSTAKGARASQLVAQIVTQNLAASGGVFRVSSDAAQIVYTIGVPDTDLQKAWTFDFDGHTFYALDLGTYGALIYDLTTQSWSNWDTGGYGGHFNMKNGFHWRDGKAVIGGGILDGLLVRLEEDSFVDEDFRPVTYEVNGVIFSSSEAFRRQYYLRLVGSPGRRPVDDDLDPPKLAMQYSDDNGATWSLAREVILTSDKKQRIQFRSLGAFSQPGRIFRLFDSGGIKFVAYVIADVEGEE